MSKLPELGAEEFRTIVERSIDGFILIDIQGAQILDANPAFCKLLGYSREEIVRMRLRDIDAKQDDQMIKDTIKLVKENGHSRFESQHRRKDGVLIDVEISANYLDIGSGCIGSFIRDISERKLVDEAKNSFVALISHQFLTPISAVRGYTDMLLNGDAGQLNTEQQTFAERIMQSNERMRAMVNDWLAMSSIELGTYQPVYSAVNLETVCREVVKYTEPRMQEKDIRLTQSYSGDVLAHTDERLIDLALENVLSNAAKYSSAGSTVHLRVSADADTVKIRVQDTGPGIYFGDQDRIFHKMYRSEEARQGKTVGTGIGLYIAKRATDYLHGTIIVASKPQSGARFTIIIPRHPKLPATD